MQALEDYSFSACSLSPFITLSRQIIDISALTIPIFDEMSMVGRKLYGQINARLCQAFPHRADEVLGGCSCLLVGDFGQLPPVMDLPFYSSVTCSMRRTVMSS